MRTFTGWACPSRVGAYIICPASSQLPVIMSREKCIQYFRKEFRCSRLLFFHWDWKAFTHSPWLTHTVKTQWIYLLYRIIVSFYFLVWLLAISINSSSPKILIFLTQWSFIALNAYLISAAVTTSINFFLVYVRPKRKRVESPPEEDDSHDGRQCCRHPGDQTTPCDKVTWVLFLLGVESAFMVTLLFWILIGNRAELSPSVNAHVHVLNGVVALVEVWLTGIPVHLLHFVYPLLFASTYGAFTGVYYAANGTGPTGERDIYPVVLDYGSQPGLAVGTLVVAIVTCLMIHLFFHFQYILRHWLTSRLQHSSRHYKRYFDPIDMSAPIPVLN